MCQYQPDESVEKVKQVVTDRCEELRKSGRITDWNVRRRPGQSLLIEIVLLKMNSPEDALETCAWVSDEEIGVLPAEEMVYRVNQAVADIEEMESLRQEMT